MPLQDQPLDISFWLNYHFHMGVSKFYLVCFCAFCAEQPHQDCCRPGTQSGSQPATRQAALCLQAAHPYVLCGQLQDRTALCLRAAHPYVHCLQYDNNSTPPMSNVLQDQIDDGIVQCKLCCCKVPQRSYCCIVLHLSCCP